MPNPSHALSASSGIKSDRAMRAKAIAYNTVDAAASLGQIALGGFTSATGLGAAVAFHGGLSFGQSATRFVGSIAMSWPDYQRLEAETNVISGVGAVVLIGEALWAGIKGTSYDLESAQRISDWGNSAVDALGLLSAPMKAPASASKWKIMATSTVNSWNNYKGYTALSQPLMSPSPGELTPIRPGQPYRPPTTAQWQRHFRERESAQDRTIRSAGGTPRVNDQGFNRDIQRGQIERRLPPSGRSDKSYNA